MIICDRCRKSKPLIWKFVYGKLGETFDIEHDLCHDCYKEMKIIIENNITQQQYEELNETPESP